MNAAWHQFRYLYVQSRGPPNPSDHLESNKHNHTSISFSSQGWVFLSNQRKFNSRRVLDQRQAWVVPTKIKAAASAMAKSPMILDI